MIVAKTEEDNTKVAKLQMLGTRSLCQTANVDLTAESNLQPSGSGDAMNTADNSDDDVIRTLKRKKPGLSNKSKLFCVFNYSVSVKIFIEQEHFCRKDKKKKTK